MTTAPGVGVGARRNAHSPLFLRVQNAVRARCQLAPRAPGPRHHLLGRKVRPLPAVPCQHPWGRRTSPSCSCRSLVLWSNDRGGEEAERRRLPEPPPDALDDMWM